MADIFQPSQPLWIVVHFISPVFTLFGATQPQAENLALCVIATIAGVIINSLFKRYGQQDVICETPRWNYHLAIMFQLIVFPVIVVLAWDSKNFEKEWFEAGWATYPSMKYEWLFIYVLVAYLAKDFFVKMTFMLYLHHVVCLVGTLAWIFVPHEGVNCFTTGTMCLEVGSASYNIWHLHPNTKASNPLFFLVMTGSNTLSLLAAWQFAQLPGVPTISRVCFLVTTIGLCIMRQKTCMDCCAAPKVNPGKELSISQEEKGVGKASFS